mgnify:CR=1 FL=1
MEIEDWRGSTETKEEERLIEYDDDHYLIKEERMPDGRTKLILKEKDSGEIVERMV